MAFGLENHAVPYDEMHRRVSEALKQVDMLERADYELMHYRGDRSSVWL